MDLESKIKEILQELGTDIKFHRLAKDNFIIEIDYDKYTEKLKSILGEYISTPEILE